MCHSFVAQILCCKLRSLYLKHKFEQQYHSMRSLQINQKLLFSAQQYLKLQWQYDKMETLKNKSLSFKTLNDADFQLLKTRIDILFKIPLFQNLKYDFVLQVALEAQLYILPPNNHLTKVDTITEGLYIIEEGFCIQMNKNHKTVLSSKMYFGVTSLFIRQTILCEIKTLTFAKLLFIDNKLLDKVGSKFPQIKRDMKEATENFTETFTEIQLSADEETVQNRHTDSEYYLNILVNTNFNF